MTLIQKTIGVFLLLLLILGFGCEQVKVPETDNNFVRGGAVRLSCLGSFETFDPQKIIFSTDWKVASIIFQGLTAISNDFNAVRPVLAKEWKILDGGRRFFFTLHDSVYFHADPCFRNLSQRKLSGYDVLASFKRLAGLQNAAPGWYLFDGKIEGINDYRNGLNSEISGIIVHDSTHVEFRLTRPYANFLKLLSTPSAYVLSKKAIEFYGERLDRHPIGTGAFYLKIWKQLDYLQLERNENFWIKDNFGNVLPYLDQVFIYFISNPVLRKTDFLSGKLDLIEIGEYQAEKILDNPQYRRDIKVVRRQMDLNRRFFAFTLDKNTRLSKDYRLRQAIAYAFNRDKIAINKTRTIESADTFAPKLLIGGSSASWYPYNLKEARKILDEAGVPNLNLPITVASNIEGEDIDLLIEGINKLGFRSEKIIKKVDYFPYIVTDRPDIFRVSFHPAYPDPEEYYSMFHSRSSAMINLSGYQNAQFDQLFDQAAVEQNQRARVAIFNEMEAILKRDVPALYLKQSLSGYIISRNQLNNVNVFYNTYDLTRAWIDVQNEVH